MTIKTAMMILFFMFWRAAAVSGGEMLQAEGLKIAAAPRLDGRLDEEFWQNAKELDNFYMFKEDAADRDTEVRIAYDSAWLYLGVRCLNKQLNLLKNRAVRHDDGVNEDDSVEVFIDPGSGGKTYFHFMLNAANITADQRVINNNRDREWNPQWRSAALQTDDGWTAEMAIPISLLASYGDVNKLRMNICRNKRVPSIDQQGVVVGEVVKLSSWAPVTRGFHEPESFKSLKLETNAGITFPFMVTFAVENVGHYYATNGQFYFNVDLALRGADCAAGEVEMLLLDRPCRGKERRIAENVKIDSAQPRKIVIPVPVDSLCRRSLALELKDRKTGEIFQKEIITELPSLDIISSYFDRNYYTTEETASLYYAVAMSPENLEGMSLVIKNEKGETICREGGISAGLPMGIPLKGFPEGGHKLRLELLGREGAVYFDVDCRLIKRKPEPGGEWKVDIVNRVVLNNGKPFFPFGIVVHKIKPDENDKFKEIADMGFNSFLCWQEAGPEDLPAFCKAAAEHKLCFMPIIDDMMAQGYPVELESLEKYFSGQTLEKLKKSYSTSALTGSKGIGYTPAFRSLSVDQRTEIYAEKYRKVLPRILEGVNYAKKYPATAAYFIFDEPLSDVCFRQAEIGRDFYGQIYKTDGYHPVMVNYSSDIPYGDQYMSFMDILMTDPYWVPGSKDASGRGSINWVSKTVAETDRRASKFRQAVWIVPMAEFWSGCRKRIISGREQVCQSYLALINGAKGLLYYSYPIMSLENQDAFKMLSGQIKEMEAALLGPRVNQEIQYYNAIADAGQDPKFEKEVFAPENDRFTDIQAGLFKYPGGDYLLLAANCRSYPVDAAFNINELAEKVKSLFSGTSPAAEKNIFHDRLEPFGTRAYVFSLSRAISPVKVEIRTTHQGKDVPPPESFSGDARSGKINEQPNPSFEEAFIKGWPDYYLSGCKYNVGLIGSPGAHWGTDDTVAKFGKKSLKMVQPFERAFASVYWSFKPQNDVPVPYTFSCWLKGGKDGMKVSLRNYEVAQKEFSITSGWNRYHLTFDMPPAKKFEYDLMFDILTWDQGTVWIDGIQLEKGTQPTDFGE